MRILIIGAGGMLGNLTQRYLKERGHDVTGVTKTKKLPGIINLDVLDETALTAFLNETPFDVVINCAALLVGPSESHHAEAVKLNAWLPHFLEGFYAESGTYIIQVSTDGVFSGLTGSYGESDCSDTESFYGKSKYLGELQNQKDLTVRSGFWGADLNPHGAGLFQWFMRQRGPVLGFTRALFNGISNLEFAKFTEEAMQSRWSGIFHLCASDTISKYQFLALQNRVFSRNVQIDRREDIAVDRSLQNARSDIAYRRKSFERMMEELRDYMAGREGF